MTPAMPHIFPTVLHMLAAAADAAPERAALRCGEERLTRYKIPRDIRICATLPKTTVGKIDKVALKAAHRG